MIPATSHTLHQCATLQWQVLNPDAHPWNPDVEVCPKPSFSQQVCEAPPLSGHSSIHLLLSPKRLYSVTFVPAPPNTAPGQPPWQKNSYQQSA